MREPSDVGDLRALVQDVTYLKNTMDEFSDLAALRMKAMMDRRSKALSIISNIMKKVSQTDESIIRAIK